MQFVSSLNAARGLNPDVGDILLVPLGPITTFFHGEAQFMAPIMAPLPLAPLGFTQRGTAGGERLKKGEVTALIPSFLPASHPGC